MAKRFVLRIIPKIAATSMSVTIFLIKERRVMFWGKPPYYLSTFASTKKRLDSNFIHIDFRLNITFHISLVSYLINFFPL